MSRCRFTVGHNQRCVFRNGSRQTHIRVRLCRVHRTNIKSGWLEVNASRGSFSKDRGLDPGHAFPRRRFS